METKFTAGPWVTNYDGNGARSIETEDGRQICYVRNEDNARLIAAVHDLLEALKWYVENDDTNIGMEGNEFWEEGLERGKAAIKKATGE